MNSETKGGVDSVGKATESPEQGQPWAELGLREDEYLRIREILGRRPTSSELAMYSVMWSEHCSYKSSKVHLRQFGEKVTPEMKRHLMVGMGENAGVVDVGEGLAVTFKVESHNHPSYIEPFQGAATGVGGIVRDILTMGARPVAVMDQLRFGEAGHPDTERVMAGVVSGISFYGNCLGLPNIGGETVFDRVYQSNPLVNALCVGVLKHDQLKLAKADHPGDLVVLFGARTGADGIGGVSVLASETFDSNGPTKRPAVQVGDPFAEKVLIECCLELFEAGVVSGIQDLGGAGISCATSELASNGNRGMQVQLQKVLLRDPTLSPEEILMSESQERMMAIVPKRRMRKFKKIAKRWEVEYSILGHVTRNPRLRVFWGKDLIVDVPPRTVAHDGPVYERPIEEPAKLQELRANTARFLKRAESATELAVQIRRVIDGPNQASKSYITDQYDRYVMGNTALAMPDDAGMIRVSEESGLGIALSTDANGRYCALDPYEGAKLALGEAFRNVSMTGATPRAVTNCLNFGSPENPNVMWQFERAVSGLADGCQELEIPVTGGNVSFYNQTGDSAIHPTPVVGVLGVIDDVARRIPSGWQDDGHHIYLLGTTEVELSGGEWAYLIHGHLGGVPPRAKLQEERDLQSLISGANQQGLIASAHDLSDGGLVVAISECIRRFGVGARIWLDELRLKYRIDETTALFSESQARALVSVSHEDEVKFAGLCEARGVPYLRIGVTDKTHRSLELQGIATLEL